MRLLTSFTLLIFSIGLFAQSSPEQFRFINSGYDEQNPVLSPDGQTLFFTIGNHPANTGGIKDPGDIWYSQKEGMEWSKPLHGGTLLNDKAYNAVAGFSPDGSQLFLHGHYGPQGAVARTQGISVARRTGDGWSRPVNVNIPYFMNKSGILHGALSHDNTVFVFSAESYGTYGVDDLYVSLHRQGQWTAPRNLGTTINTQFQELSPSISHDLQTLYFSSNGRKGHGSFDIYSATRLDDTWTNWSTPENLGEGVNSEGRELFFRYYPDAGMGLFTTTKSSDGYGDLRVYAPLEPLPGHDTVIFASLEDSRTPEEPSLRNEIAVADATTKPAVAEKEPEGAKNIQVHGEIRNAATGQPVVARISFEGPDMEPKSVQSGEQGYALTLLPSQYSIRIEATGFISTLEKLDMTSMQLREQELNFNLQPVEVGATVNLRNVLFAQAKTDILPESYPELDLVVSFLKENPKIRIELMGHTDGRGVHADNVRLSQQRVNKVKQYLVSKGIEPRRISGKGFGGSKPIASNDTEESRRINRRVEFVIKKSP